MPSLGRREPALPAQARLGTKVLAYGRAGSCLKKPGLIEKTWA